MVLKHASNRVISGSFRATCHIACALQGIAFEELRAPFQFRRESQRLGHFCRIHSDLQNLDHCHHYPLLSKIDKIRSFEIYENMFKQNYSLF